MGRVAARDAAAGVSFLYLHHVVTGMDEIYDGLWITSLDGVQMGSTGQFDRLVSVCQDTVTDHVAEHQAYEWHNICDGATCDQYGGSESYESFWKAASSVADAVGRGESVLVHCHAGQSRSAAVCIAALHEIAPEETGVVGAERWKQLRDVVESARPQIHMDDQLAAYSMRFVRGERP